MVVRWGGRSLGHISRWPKAVGTVTPPAPSALIRGRNASNDAGTTGNLFVSTSGNDSTGNGSFGNPYRTIQKAHDIATSGQVVKVRAGEYQEQLTITKPLEISGYGTEFPAISGAYTVTGWTACTSGDSGVLGANWSGVYKATINKSILQSTNLTYYNALLLTEAGTPRDLSQRRKVTSDLWEQSDSATMYSSTLGDGVSMTVDGSGYIATISHSAVLSGYTDAQLARCYVMVHADPNIPKCLKVTSASSSVLTVESNTSRPQKYATTPEYTYALLNALPSIISGQWGFVDSGGSTIDLYVYPTNVANLTSGIQIVSKTYVVDLQAAATNCKFRNIDFKMCADSAASGFAIMRTGASGADGLDVQQCSFSRFSHKEKGYAGIYIFNTDDFIFRNNDVWDGQNQYGIFVNGGGYRTRIDQNHFYHVSQGGYRIYNVFEIAVTHNLIENCGRGAHANKINFYEQSDKILVLGNEWINCGGYITLQEASRMLCINNKAPTNETGRSFDDQTNGTLNPVNPSNNYIVGNLFPLAPGATGGTALQADQDVDSPNDVNWGVYGNVAHGILVQPSQLISQTDNVNTNGAPAGSGEVQVTDLLTVYYDPSNGDYNTVPGSILTSKPGPDVTAIITEWEGYFPDVNIRRDITGATWNPADWYVGPYGKAWPVKADVTPPVLSNFVAGAASASVEISIDVNEIGSSIYWVRLPNGATTPTDTQIIAGQDASGAAAGLSGNIQLVSSTGTKALGNVTGPAATYKISVVAIDRNGNKSNIVNGSATTASFTPVWRAFDGVQWLRKATAITGAQASTKNWTMAYTIKRSAGQLTTNSTGGVLSTTPTNGNHVIDASSTGRIRAKHKLTGGTTAVFDKSAPTSGTAVADEEYCIIESYTSSPGGGVIAKMKIIRISDGSVIANQPTDYTDPADNTMSFASTTAFDIFKAAITAERFMLWDNSYGAADDSAVQLLFVKSGGGLEDPNTAVASLGTPLISIYGNNLSTGTNTGSGGNWTLS